ncbi:hypothetical protein JTE90_003398 [Oedothorax gibbosus]|uniref:Uncharacterized protein n=1 Tax=Oedothorax gibbosus TaxID=931172 RepID=A0AAV6TXN3_9ARAC|nr:hypothetical protein JTE90_003398 [Oedothorax gibbosus]
MVDPTRVPVLFQCQMMNFVVRFLERKQSHWRGRKATFRRRLSNLVKERLSSGRVSKSRMVDFQSCQGSKVVIRKGRDGWSAGSCSLEQVHRSEPELGLR